MILNNEFTSPSQVVTEAYYGKPKEFLAIEKELDVIIKKIKDSVSLNSTKGYIIEQNCAKISKIFKDFFGFYEFNLAILPSLPNAMTCPFSYHTFTSDKSGKFKNRPDTSKMIVSVYLFDGFILNINATAQELMAVILHEIGHNMDRSVFMALSKYLPWFCEITWWSDGTITKKWPEIKDYIKALVGRTGLTIGFNILSKYANKITDIFTSTPGTRRLMWIIDEIVTGTKQIVSFTTRFRRPIPPPELILLLFANPRSFFGYAGEKYADSFAVAYGYGVELSTAFSRVNDEVTVTTKAIMSVPVLSAVFDFSRISTSLPFIFCDEHPQDVVRVNSAIKKLKRELKDPSIPPKMKKDIEEQIVEIEKVMYNMADIRGDKASKEPFTVMLNFVLVKVFNGMLDPREVLELIFRHEE